MVIETGKFYLMNVFNTCGDLNEILVFVVKPVSSDGILGGGGVRSDIAQFLIATSPSYLIKPMSSDRAYFMDMELCLSSVTSYLYGFNRATPMCPIKSFEEIQKSDLPLYATRKHMSECFMDVLKEGKLQYSSPEEA